MKKIENGKLKIENGASGSRKKECFYPDCLQCCCTTTMNGSPVCQAKEIETPRVARELLTGIAWALGMSVVLVIVLMWLWASLMN